MRELDCDAAMIAGSGDCEKPKAAAPSCDHPTIGEMPRAARDLRGA